ncbi:MAG: hypothetical protein WCJ29_02545 [bacterium]
MAAFAAVVLYFVVWSFFIAYPFKSRYVPFTGVFAAFVAVVVAVGYLSNPGEVIACGVLICGIFVFFAFMIIMPREE